jgi:competence protein ComEC
VLDPLAIFSASFQMSYSVVFAILGFGLPLAERMALRLAPFRDMPEATWTWWQRAFAAALRWFWPVLGIGMAAALVSAVSGPEFFHVWAPGGLVANLVLVPLAMLVIVAGFASIIAGLAGVTLLGALFNHAAITLLVAIEWLIRGGLRAPGIWWAANWRAPWMASATLALLLCAVIAGYALGWKKERGGWWPPLVIASLGLLFGVKFG